MKNYPLMVIIPSGTKMICPGFLFVFRVHVFKRYQMTWTPPVLCLLLYGDVIVSRTHLPLQTCFVFCTW